MPTANWLRFGAFIGRRRRRCRRSINTNSTNLYFVFICPRESSNRRSQVWVCFQLNWVGRLAENNNKKNIIIIKAIAGKLTSTNKPSRYPVKSCDCLSRTILHMHTNHCRVWPYRLVPPLIVNILRLIVHAGPPYITSAQFVCVCVWVYILYKKFMKTFTLYEACSRPENFCP